MYYSMLKIGRIPFYLIMISLLIVHCQGQSIVEYDRIIYSHTLRQDTEYSVLLPDDYHKSDTKRYPAIYLLHGINGDQNSWLQRCQVNTIVDSLNGADEFGDFIFVMPAAYNSYYINNHDSSFRYMDYFIEFR